MTIEEFLEQYNYTFCFLESYPLEEIAKALLEIDDKDLRSCACNFLDELTNIQQSALRLKNWDAQENVVNLIVRLKKKEAKK